MKRSSFYNYLTSAIIVAVLMLSTGSTIVSAQVLQSAQNSADPVLNNLNNKADNSNSLYSNAPTVDSYTTSPNTSANTASQNTNGLPADAPGGSGNAPTSFAWKMLMPWYWVQASMKILGNTILMIFGWVLGLVGLIFNLIIDKTIVNLKSTIDSLGVINDIWKTIRDFINLFFIFSLLYAAVGTVLGIDKVDWKKTVGNLVLAALLINFSLFITKAVLDISNIVTIGFYSQLPGVGVADINPTNLNASSGSTQGGGISNSIMQSLKLETIYKPSYDGTGNGSVADANNDSIVGSFAFILSTVMGSIFICVTIVVMVAACWLFLRRFIDILFLMIRSPIAFAGLVLPKLESYQADWWSDLQKNAVFPPVYMAMMWITFKILQSPGFQTVAPGTDGFGDVFKSLGPTTINIVFRFIIVIMMMVYALKSAGKVGVEGGEIFTDYLKKKKGQLQGVVGRNTLGRGAAWAQDKNSVAGQALRNLEAVPIIGKATSGAIRDGLKNVSGNDFGGAKGGFDAAIKAKAKEAEEGYARVGEKAEFREAFRMVEPKNPEPVQMPGESEVDFIARRSKYDESSEKEEYEIARKKYEEAKTTHEVNKKAFEQDQEEKAKSRQAQYKGNYDANVVTSRIGGTGPLFAGNAAALKAIEKKIETEQKKKDKEDKSKASLERIRTEQADAENEMVASYKKYAESAGATPETIGKLTALLNEKFDGIKDEKERVEKLRKNREAIKTIVEEIQTAEEAVGGVADRELKAIAQQQAAIKRIEIGLAGLDQEKRTAEKPTTDANIQQLQSELADATKNLKKLERAPIKRAEILKNAEAKRNEAATKREQVITRENQMAQDEKLDSLGKDLGDVKDKTGKKDEGGGGDKPKDDKKK